MILNKTLKYAHFDVSVYIKYTEGGINMRSLKRLVCDHSNGGRLELNNCF